MTLMKPWTVSDALWCKIEPLLLVRKRMAAGNTSASMEQVASRCRRGRSSLRLSMCLEPGCQ
jgi:hypothetical protein